MQLNPTCAAKAKMKSMRGVSRNFLQSYIDEFCWRRIHTEPINYLLVAMSKYADKIEVLEEANNLNDEKTMNVHLYDEQDDQDFTVPPFTRLLWKHRARVSEHRAKVS